MNYIIQKEDDNYIWTSNGILIQKKYDDNNIKKIYNDSYFNEYIKREGSPIAYELNTKRVELVKNYAYVGLDMGIGSGAFIKYMWVDNTIPFFGYDINENGIEWLKSKRLYFNPYTDSSFIFDCVTFFDSLEHIPDFSFILNKIYLFGYAIISIPIFDNIDDVFISKHFKPNEHLYYFTEKGLIDVLRQNKFELTKKLDFEKQLGRENVYTYVFRKTIL
jgi:hypothetical protein